MASDGRGRKELPPEKRLVPIPMRIEQWLFDEVCNKARRAGVAVAAELRRLVHKAHASER